MDGKEEHEAQNVVRFPRDWVGPLEDLVPVGARARARAREAEQEQHRLEAEQGGHELSDDCAPAADDFWGEGAAAVHTAMQAPYKEPVAQPAPPRRRRRRPRPPAMPYWLENVRWPLVAAACVLLAVIVIAAIGLTERGSGEPAPRATSADAPVTTRAVTTPNVAPAPRHHAGSEQSAADRRRARHRAHDLRQDAARASQASHHQLVTYRQVRAAALKRKATVVREVTVTEPAPPTPTPTPTDSPVEDAASPVTGSSQPLASSAADSSSTSSAGPAGPGSATGCNPKCR